MEPNVIDLLVRIMTQLRTGRTVKELKPEDFTGYNASEMSAAYSWLYQRYPELSKDGKLVSSGNGDPAHRILHLAEKVLIGSESYGYLLRLVYAGLLSASQMESIIERIMLQHHEKISLEKLKPIVAQFIQEGSLLEQISGSSNLSGLEKIN